MAIIENIKSGEKIVLCSHHVFGRQAINTDTRLIHPEISNIHASIRWNGEVWTLKDHSLNGTWLESERIRKNRDVALEVGQLIGFGSLENDIWRIQHLSRPVSTLVALDDQGEDIILQQIHVLPDESDPQLSLYLLHSGQWVCEQGDKTFQPVSGDIISLADGRRWRLHLPDNIELTSEVSVDEFIALDHFGCRFSVSADEEHVFLKIRHQELEFDLQERVHHYLLLLLARQRDKDVKKGFDKSSQGWVYLDELSNMLGVTLTHLNILIFRARKQMQQVLQGLPSVPQLIERRQGSIRLGFSKISYV
ncbi:hypothetical protein MNBD_GAMMA10-1600 [hydrothermal vent metagenome]|uniref:FHA domain-containing protein n=1 Tax=hydrothermal vent metagenome TaxID=652676 RepID=A0A3B0XVJ9_9ZZZZ